MILVVIVGIALLSLFLSYLSVQSDKKKSKYAEVVKKDLAKGRVIYYGHTPNKSQQEENAQNHSSSISS